MYAIIAVLFGLVCASLVIAGLVTVALALVLVLRDARQKADGGDGPDGPSEM